MPTDAPAPVGEYVLGRLYREFRETLPASGRVPLDSVPGEPADPDARPR